MTAVSNRRARRRVQIASAALACGLCAAVAVPSVVAPSVATASTTFGSAQSVVGDPVLASGTGAPAVWNAAAPENLLLGQVLDESSGPAIVIVVPGTDDTGLHPRIDRLVGSRQTGIVQYPESFGPVITGKSDTFLGLPFFAPSYLASRTAAETNILAAMRAFESYDGAVVYTGYSQGAEALGNAVEAAARQGTVLGPNSLAVLISDPRTPWGIKTWAGDLPLSGLWLTPLLSVIGIDNNGARDPGASGDVQVISVIVAGDPVSNWQWTWYRPVSSLLVDAAGFLAIHSPGDGPYGHLDGSANADGHTLIVGGPTMLHSEDGHTAYAVYDTYHPLALMNAMLYDAVGIDYDDDDLARWDRYAQAFYPLSEPTAAHAGGGVTVGEGNGGLQATGPRAAAVSGTPAPVAVTGYSAPLPEDAAGAGNSAAGDSAAGDSGRRGRHSGGGHRLRDENFRWQEPQGDAGTGQPKHGESAVGGGLTGDSATGQAPDSGVSPDGVATDVPPQNAAGSSAAADGLSLAS